MKEQILFIAIKFNSDKNKLYLIVRRVASQLPSDIWRFICTVDSTKEKIEQSKLSWMKQINKDFNFNFKSIEVI